MQAIVAGAAGVALLGIVETFLGRPLIHPDLPPHARPFGPFANRNHAASLLVLALPLALGLARAAERAAERTTAPRRATPWIAAAALLVMALLVNGSRGGTLTALALLAFTFALARLRPWVKVAAAAGLALALVLPGSAWTRRADTITVGERVALARDALTMTRDAPLTGIGLGAFGAAYPPYQRVAKDLRFRHVESEPFELLVEGGVPLLGLALAAGALLASLAARMVRATRDPLAKAIAVSALAVPIHACFDFPLRVPGVVVPWLLVVGSLLALADAARRAASAPPPSLGTVS
jgi:O-antigen ligase